MILFADKINLILFSFYANTFYLNMQNIQLCKYIYLINFTKIKIRTNIARMSIF